MIVNQDDKTITGVLISDSTIFTLDELCNVCTVRTTRIVALVEEGILEPSGAEQQQWRFSGTSLRRARTAMRLQDELELNLAGTALALDLIEEVRALRRRLQRLEGH